MESIRENSFFNGISFGKCPKDMALFGSSFGKSDLDLLAVEGMKGWRGRGKRKATPWLKG